MAPVGVSPGRLDRSLATPVLGTSPQPLLHLPSAEIPVGTVTARSDPVGFPNALGTIQPVPATYSDLTNSPSPGAVVGIVLGSVAAFLLVLALFYTCCSFGRGTDGASSWAAASAVTLRAHHHRHDRDRLPSLHSRRRSRRGGSPIRLARAQETIEIVRSRSPHILSPGSLDSLPDTPPRPPGPARDAIIVDAVPPPTRDRSSRRTSTGRDRMPPVPIDDDFSDDEIVVVESNNAQPRRSASRRSDTRRRSSVVYRDGDTSRRGSTSRR